MASVTLTKEEFVDFIVSFLLDKMLHENKMLPADEEFNELSKTLISKGVKQTLLFHYLKSTSISRGKYDFVKKVFQEGSKDNLYLSILGEVESVKEPSTIKNLIKKALKIIKAHRKRTGFPLNEKKINKIIDKLLLEEGLMDKE